MRICLFDIDGTLIASGGAGKAALECALTAEFGVEEILPKLQLSGRTDTAIVHDLLTIHDIEPTPESVDRIKNAYLRQLPKSLANSTGNVLPGIQSLVSELHQREDVAIGLLTGNIRAGAKIKLGHYQLVDYFDFGGFGDNHFHRNDVARDALTEVQKRFHGQVNVEDILVIGDTPLDIQCARAIGAKAVAVATGWHSEDELTGHQPDLFLHDLSDPTPLLALWS